MKIVVTGGLGYIGSHTCVELLNKGFEVVIIDDLSNSNLFFLDRIQEITGLRPAFYQIDVTDAQALYRCLQQESNIQGIIHFAAKKSVAESVANPSLYYYHNINGLINVVYCCEQLGIQHLIFSSSATVYGQPEENPITEETPFYCPATSSYARTKQLGEWILEDFARMSTLQSICLRYFNPIGAHGSGLIGELPQGTPNNLMPYITQVAIGKRPYLSVFGTDYETPDGTCVRDYIHVVDLAKAHCVALTRLLEGKNTHAIEAYNIGTGKGYSVFDVIHSFNKAYGKTLPYQVAPRRAGDVPVYYSNPSKAYEVLGWKAELDLDAMTSSSWVWEQKMRG